MVKGSKYVMDVPAHLVGTVVSFLSARFGNYETEKRGVKEVVWEGNLDGQVFVRGLPAPVIEQAALLTEGILLGLSGRGFDIDPAADEEENTEEV